MIQAIKKKFRIDRPSLVDKFNARTEADDKFVCIPAIKKERIKALISPKSTWSPADSETEPTIDDEEVKIDESGVCDCEICQRANEWENKLANFHNDDGISQPYQVSRDSY